jgi:NAD(P)-dependent dehydrogenase (short-subunit alcohol dehydrogenase family)
MGLLDHKTAVITGGNSGIGLATAGRFIAEGAARVFITGRRLPELSAAATQLGSRAVAVPGDVGTPADLDRLYTEVDAAGKGLDVVVANAGSTRVARLADITEDDDLDTLLTTNVKGVVYTVQKSSAAAQRWRLDHPDRVHHRRSWSSGIESLRRIQGRRPLVGARLGERARRPGHPGQRPRGGIDRDTRKRQAGRTDRSQLLDRGVPRGTHLDHPARALRRSCRDRQRSSVFGQRPVQLHDGIHHHRRRWVQPGLMLLRKQIDDSGEHRGHGLRGRHDARPGGSVGGNLKQGRSQHAVAPSQLTPLAVVILWATAHHTVDQ